MSQDDEGCTATLTTGNGVVLRCDRYAGHEAPTYHSYTFEWIDGDPGTTGSVNERCRPLIPPANDAAPDARSRLSAPDGAS